MDDRGAYIDVVFRNGLKDFEVLPPVEVWENIRPAVAKRSRSFLIFKVAASIIVLLSLSYVVYLIGEEISVNTAFMASNEGLIYPEYDPIAINKSPVIVLNKRNRVIESPKILNNSSNSEIFVANVDVRDTDSQDMLYVPDKDVAPRNTETLSAKPEMSEYITAEGNMLLEGTGLNDFYLLLNENVKPSVRWSIAALASPTYYSTMGLGKDDFANQLANSEQAILSYSGGVAFSYKINKRLSIQSGLFYASVGKEINGVNSFGGFQKYDYTKGDRNFEVLTTSGTVYTNNADVFLSADGSNQRILTNYTNDVFDPAKASLNPINDNLLQNFSYLELPVFLRYKLIDKTVDFNLIGGVSYNMLVNNAVYTMVDGGRYNVGKTEGLNPISLSSSLGMGMEYSFSENLSLNLEPTFRYYLNPFSQSSSSGTHPYSFGIFSGLSYKF